MNEQKKHIDYEIEQERRGWHFNKSGGAASDNLTVRDVFAAECVNAIIKKVDFDEWSEVATAAYALADAMMKERDK